MYQIIFVQIRQVTECLKCDIFFEMFIQILFDEPTFFCDLLSRSNGQCCLCLTSDIPEDQLLKFLAVGLKIFFFFPHLFEQHLQVKMELLAVVKEIMNRIISKFVLVRELQSVDPKDNVFKRSAGSA